MAVKKSQRPLPQNRRGSPEAIAKRRAGRAFNDLFSDGGRHDGRTEKRRQRLLKELAEGKRQGSGEGLKPLDVLLRVSELLDLGEPLASIKKACKPCPPLARGARAPEVIAELHSAYGFPVEAYRFVGLDDQLLTRAGVLSKPASARARGRSRPT